MINQKNKNIYHETIWNTVFDNSYGEEGGYDSPYNLLEDLCNKLSPGPFRKEIAFDRLRQICLGNESILGEKELKEAFIKQLADIEEKALEKKAVDDIEKAEGVNDEELLVLRKNVRPQVEKI